MKVKDLLKKLKGIDPEMEVFCTSAKDEYQYCPVISAKVQVLIIEDGEYKDYEDDDFEDEEVETFVISEE